MSDEDPLAKHLTGPGIPDPRLCPFLSVEDAGVLIGLGRSKAYVQARRFLDTDGAEGLPCIAFGRSLRVPTAALWRLAGLDPEDDSGSWP